MLRSPQNAKAIKTARLAKAIRGLKLLKLVKVLKLQSLNYVIAANMLVWKRIIRLNQFFVGTFVFTHFNACLWSFSTYDSSMNSDTWINAVGLTDASVGDRYCAAFYW